MKGKLGYKMGALAALLAMVLLVPALAQAKGKKWQQLKEMKMEIIKKLKLPPDKEKYFKEVDHKFDKERQQIITDLKKSQKELQKAMQAAKPDPMKVKGLVSAITNGQNKLFDSFKNQRDEELGLLTPLEQGKYMLALNKWRHKMMGKCMKELTGKKAKKGKKKKKK